MTVADFISPGADLSRYEIPPDATTIWAGLPALIARIILFDTNIKNATIFSYLIILCGTTG